MLVWLTLQMLVVLSSKSITNFMFINSYDWIYGKIVYNQSRADNNMENLCKKCIGYFYVKVWPKCILYSFKKTSSQFKLDLN